MTIVRGPRPEAHFTILRNDLLQDERLTYRALGVLASVLSRPDNWSASAASLSKPGDREGREAVRSALGELASFGYLKREKVKDSRGRWVTVSVIYDQASDSIFGGNPTGQSTIDGFPGVGSPGVGFLGAKDQSTVTEEPKDKTLDVESPPPVPSKKDLVFEAVCHACGIDWSQLTPSGRGPLGKAVKEIKAAMAVDDDARVDGWEVAMASEVQRRAGNWPYDVPLTPLGLAKHWAALDVDRRAPNAKGLTAVDIAGQAMETARTEDESGPVGIRAFIDTAVAAVQVEGDEDEESGSAGIGGDAPGRLPEPGAAAGDGDGAGGPPPGG